MNGDALEIRNVMARAVDVPLQRPMRTAAGEIPSAPLVLIDLETQEGVPGRAYIFGYTSVTLKPLVALLGALAEPLIGEAVAPLARMRDFEARFRLLGRQGLLGMALSGVDMALWDTLARARELPLARLLGGEPRALPAYDSYGVIDPVHDRAEIERSLERGFTAIKIKIGDGDLRKDVETVAAVRDIVGDSVGLMVDFNQSQSVPEAIRRIERLSPYDLLWAEEPVPAEDLDGHAKVRAAVPVSIQTGENWWFPQDMAKAIAAGAGDLAMPDVMKIGGVTGWLEALARAASLPVSSHAFVEASAHLLAVTPTAQWLEFLDKARPILQAPAEVVNGTVTPRGPGLGLEWDEKAVERYLV
ncbi:MAG: hypothetical protein MI920_25020 [Kiloniellales bacterium]|nr:hypothetical protein [Kiloniellales bacterium]